MFLAYLGVQKDYKYYRLELCQFFVSADVRLFENTMFFIGSQSTKEVTEVLPLPVIIESSVLLPTDPAQEALDHPPIVQVYTHRKN